MSAVGLMDGHRVADGHRRLGRWAVEAITLAGLVAGVFALIVLGLGHVPTNREPALLGFSAVAAAVSALLWTPARRRLRPLATRIAGGGRATPDEVLRVLASRLAEPATFDELLPELAEALRRNLALEAAEIWIASGSLLERAASDPARGRASVVLTDSEVGVVARTGIAGGDWAAMWLPVLLDGRGELQLRVAPIVEGGELLGIVIVERSASAGRFDAAEEHVLAELSRRVGLALRNVRLGSALQASLDELRLQAAELRASRARVVAAADAERRRIERDLHDGAQQQLIALAVNLRLARSLAASNAGECEALLAELSRDALDALEQVQTLAHGIYPPLLLDSGLQAALASAASRAAIEVRFEADRLERYGPDVEATVYFCCLEALQNAAKHAGEAARATLSISGRRDQLSFEVSDDGVGFDPAARRDGSGLVNMTDRLGAMGGRLSITSEPGRGTSVTGIVPLHRL